uniref:Uncharacterized protein n=1 Tax=Rhizophora mucronata TaxID=61149 RepID=A0A2P2LNW6_RHIMU
MSSFCFFFFFNFSGLFFEQQHEMNSRCKRNDFQS